MASPLVKSKRLFSPSSGTTIFDPAPSKRSDLLVLEKPGNSGARGPSSLKSKSQLATGVISSAVTIQGEIASKHTKVVERVFIRMQRWERLNISRIRSAGHSIRGRIRGMDN